MNELLDEELKTEKGINKTTFLFIQAFIFGLLGWAYIRFMVEDIQKDFLIICTIYLQLCSLILFVYLKKGSQSSGDFYKQTIADLTAMDLGKKYISIISLSFLFILCGFGLMFWVLEPALTYLGEDFLYRYDLTFVLLFCFMNSIFFLFRNKILKK